MQKIVPTFPRYKVDENGNVWSDVTKRFLKAGTDRDGYRYVVLSVNKKQYTKKVHRLVAECFLENWSPDLEVDHINDVRNDNRLINLRMVTHQENMVKTLGKPKIRKKNRS